MRTYSELIEVMTQQQRIKRSIVSKKVAKIAARKRAITAKKPPTAEKINQAVTRQVRKKALSIVDKSHVYHSAAAATKAQIEKKASKLEKKKGKIWAKKLRQQITQKMKDDYRKRTKMGKTPGQPDATGFADESGESTSAED